jgi:hypothetical protein
MSDRTEKLRSTLGELHDELSGAAALDGDSRALLESALGEIRAALAQPVPHATLVAEPLVLAERLRDAALRVEGEHPALAAAVGRFLDALASLGI